MATDTTRGADPREGKVVGTFLHPDCPLPPGTPSGIKEALQHIYETQGVGVDMEETREASKRALADDQEDEARVPVKEIGESRGPKLADDGAEYLAGICTISNEGNHKATQSRVAIDHGYAGYPEVNPPFSPRGDSRSAPMT